MTFGCGSATPAEAICDAAVDFQKSCDSSFAATDADMAECQAEYASVTQECSDAMVASFKCQADNGECSEDGETACTTEMINLLSACPDLFQGMGDDAP